MHATKQALPDGRLLYDISPLISSRLAVFPGDQPFSRHELLSWDKGDHILLSSITTTVHLGAHTDAPNHYHRQGIGIAGRNLHYYLGPCQVIAAKPSQGLRIRWQDLTQTPTPGCERILLCTGSFPDPNVWINDFSALDPGLIDRLASMGVKLIGIDTPSLDPADAKELLSHDKVYEHDLAILEGIVLGGVPPGSYELIALPLRLADADASPVRAVLRSFL